MRLLQVLMMTTHLQCGDSVSINITPNTPMAEIKAQLEAQTGVPAKDQKIMLSGINQLVMGDKRCALVLMSTSMRVLAQNIC